MKLVMKLRFSKMRGEFLGLADDRLAFQEGSCAMELVSMVKNVFQRRSLGKASGL